MENLRPADTLLATNSPSNPRRARHFSCSSFISTLTQEPRSGQQEVCVYLCLCVCVCERERVRERERERKKESTLDFVVSNDQRQTWGHLSPITLSALQGLFRERVERREAKLVEALKDKWAHRQTEDGREAMDDNLLCFQSFSSLSHSLPLFPVSFYLSSLSAHPARLRPPPAATRICWKKALIFSLGRESPACSLPSQTGIGDVALWSKG